MVSWARFRALDPYPGRPPDGVVDTTFPSSVATHAALAPVTWQQQPHDRVLGRKARERGAFLDAASYVLNNPERARLVRDRAEYPYLGCCFPGYPDLDVHLGSYFGGYITRE